MRSSPGSPQPSLERSSRRTRDRAATPRPPQTLPGGCHSPLTPQLKTAGLAPESMRNPPRDRHPSGVTSGKAAPGQDPLGIRAALQRIGSIMARRAARDKQPTHGSRKAAGGRPTGATA
eukprot:11655273-Heterocapsa_arctica.AAC.2